MTKRFSIFSIKKPGIYTITGSNGCGKTTFIESALKKNQPKGKAVAYFAQKNWKYKMNVQKYLQFPETNPNLVQKYSELFSIDIYYLDKDMQLLSGGEFVKVELVRTFALDTPIIILDEPTNNLDNGSVEILSNLLRQLSKTKVIFLVSHDKRLEHLFDKKILINRERAEVSTGIELEENGITVMKKKLVSASKIFLYLLKSKFNVLMFLFLLLLTTILTIVVSNTILYSVPIERELESDYYFEMLDIGENYSRYFDTAMADSEAEEKFQKPNKLSADELVELRDEKYIDRVYVIDQSYLNELTLDNSKLELLALPEIVTGSPQYENTYPACKTTLVKGRLPEDEASEIALSYAQLEKFFDYDLDEKSAIGGKVKIEGGSYEIVGIVNSTVAAISFSRQAQPYGAIEVTDETSKQLDKIVISLKKQGYDDNVFSNIFIKTTTKNEKELLNYLETHGPSYQYFSNNVNEAIQLSLYKEKLAQIILLSVISSLVVSALIFVFGKKSFSLVHGFINDMSNLNFRPKKNKQFIYLIMLLDFLVCMPACLLLNQLIVGNSVGMLMILPTLVISLIMFMLTLLLMNYLDKKHDFRNL